MRIVFAGTPEFAVPSLEALIDSAHEVVAVFTQPDRPAGRGRKPSASPIKQRALAHRIPVYQPVSLKSAEAQRPLLDLAPEFMVVAACGLLLPPAVLAACPRGCINVHASLLPRWRGAAPIQRAILAGDRESGVTIMQMAEGLDTGDILWQQPCLIEPQDTAGALHDKLAALGAQALMEAMDGLITGRITPQPQDEALACYASKVEKQEAEMDWRQEAQRLHREIRAFNPWPVAYTRFNGKALRIWQAVVVDESLSLAPAGSVLKMDRHGIDVATGRGTLRLLYVQLPGGKRISAQDFVNAYRLEGVRFPC